MGPPPQEQVDATVAWVSDAFRAFYAREPPELPPRFARREFGFLWIGKKFFLRHTGFSTREALHEFLVREAPHHSYYSTAYYKTPHAATMKEKEWLGADLIFDLDADHLPNAESLTFEQQLAEVKKQARKLLHDYLLGDFGFDADHVRIVFSGGRGYHFHVSDPRVLQLSSAERREIVDYVSPNETVATSLYEEWVKEKAVKKDDFGNLRKTKTVPPATAPGWNGRITRTACDYFESLLHLPQDEAVRSLTQFEGIGAKTAKDIVNYLTPERLARVRDFGNLEQFGALTREAVVQVMIQQAKIHAPGETDEPVTADIKRLIRLPGSLHGKTGLRVTPLSVDAFEAFDPLRDAVAFGTEPVRVVVSKPTEITLAGKRHKVDPGEQDLPMRLALFLVLRRAALRPLAVA